MLSERKLRARGREWGTIMNDRIRKTAFLLLVGLLALCGSRLLTADVQDARDPLESLKVYEARTSTEDFAITNDYLERIENEWHSLYRDIWRAKTMDERLKEMVDKAVDTKLEAAGYWKMAKGLVYEDVFQELLQSSIDESMRLFSPLYEEFLGDLVVPFSDTLGKLISTYAEDISTVRKEATRALPGYGALLPLSLEPSLTRLQLENQSPTVKPPVRPEAISTGIAGASILVIRKVLQKRVINNLVKRLLGAAGKKVVVVVEGPIGWGIGVVLLGHDIYTIGKEIKEVPQTMKNEIYKSLRQLYLIQAPALGWKDELRDEIRIRLKETRELVSGKFDAAVKELIACPAFQRLVSDVGEKEHGDLVTKLYLLQSRTPASMCRLADMLGGVLLRVGPEELSCIESAVKNLGLDLAADWIRLGPSTVCVLTSFRTDQLLRFDPNRENLALLVWAGRLPADLQGVALGLDADTRDRVRNLNTARQIQVLRGRDPDRIRAEIERLSDQERPPEARDFWGDQVKSWASLVLAPFVSKNEIDKALAILAAFMGVAVLALMVWLMYRIGVLRLLAWGLRRIFPKKSSPDSRL
jgi:hypothetical protein